MNQERNETEEFIRFYGWREEQNKKVQIIIALIGAGATIIAAIIGTNVGKSSGVKETYSQINAEISNVAGNATITINNISDFVADYENLKNENEVLKEKNDAYFEEIQTKTATVESMRGMPSFTFKNVNYVIDGKDIPINATNSIVAIDGREYIDKEFLQKALTQEQNMTMKEDTLYIGKVIVDKENLFDQWLVSNKTYIRDNYGSQTDSKGNNYINALVLQNSYRPVIYSLDKKFTKLKFKLADSEINGTQGNAYITIKADDKTVYTSPEISFKTEAFVVEDIPIENCSLLSIEITINAADYRIIMAEAIVYN